MGSNEAKVRIGGQDTGATKVTNAVTKSVENLGKKSTEAGNASQQASQRAAEAERKYESEVQKAIKTLKNKETRTKALVEAEKRLGITGSSNQRSPGGSFFSRAQPPPTVGGVSAGGAFQALGRVGGNAGTALGGIGSSLSAISGPLVGIGIAAVGAKVGIDAMTAASERAAQEAGDAVRRAQERDAIIKAATEQLARTVINASNEGGAALRNFVARGGSIAGAQNIANATGLNTGQASQVADQVSGLDEQSRKVILQAVRDAVRLGVDPVKTAEALRATSEGGLGDLDREGALRRAGNLFDNFGGQQLAQATSVYDGDLNRLQSLQEFSTRESRAGFNTITKDAAVNAANVTTADAAARASDPIKAALDEHAKIIKKEIEVLEAMGRAEHPLIRALNDLSASFRGGRGSYASQAQQQRQAAGF